MCLGCKSGARALEHKYVMATGKNFLGATRSMKFTCLAYEPVFVTCCLNVVIPFQCTLVSVEYCFRHDVRDCLPDAPLLASFMYKSRVWTCSGDCWRV